MGWQLVLDRKIINNVCFGSAVVMGRQEASFEKKGVIGDEHMLSIDVIKGKYGIQR